MVDVQPAEAGKTRVAVIFGGRSSEHAISCVSAASVMNALDQGGFEVVPVGITPEGRWVIASGDRSELEIKDRALPAVKDGDEVVLPADPAVRGLVPISTSQRGIGVKPTEAAQRLTQVDVVFPVLHGPYGEDGTIQGLLEMADVPYVGAGVLASAVGMDKEFTKKLLTASGLPVGPYLVLRPGQEPVLGDVERLGYPVFVKPARGGSSVGVSKVRSPEELPGAVAHARETDPKVIIEAGFVGREVECGVLQSETPGGEPDTSLPAEIRVVAGHDWYDFEAKYLDDACEFDIPPNLPTTVLEEVQGLAKQAFEALNVAGLARVDFFVTPDNEIFINEINTMPGFTPVSMFARMWIETGLSYPDLVARLVRTAQSNGTGLR